MAKEEVVIAPQDVEYAEGTVVEHLDQDPNDPRVKK